MGEEEKILRRVQKIGRRKEVANSGELGKSNWIGLRRMRHLGRNKTGNEMQPYDDDDELRVELKEKINEEG